MIARAESLRGLNRFFGRKAEVGPVKMSALKFLKSLPKETSREISEISMLVGDLHPNGASFTIVAVGDSVRKASKHSPVGEVDLLILTDAGKETPERKVAVEYVANAIKDGLLLLGHNVYEAAPVEARTEISDGISLRTDDSTPLHVTVVGPGSEPTKGFIDQEKKNKEDMAVILKSKAA
jgi:hypothetical protein